MGLLETVLINKNSNTKLTTQIVPEFWETFLRKKKELPIDELYPKKVLNLFLKILNLKKGIILSLNSKNNIWTPLIYEGIDITSARRIRLSKIFLKTYLTGNYSRVNDEKELQNFKNFFSIRESAMLSSIDFYHSDRIILMIPFSEEESLSKPSKEVLTIVKGILDDIAGIVVKSELEGENDISLTLFLSNFIKKHSDKKIFMYKVVLKELINLIKESSTEVSGILSLEQNIIDIINSMIQNEGQLLQVDSEIFILLYSGISIGNSNLLAAQITNTLKNYFVVDIEPYQLLPHHAIYPEDGSTPDELLLKLNT